MMKLKIEVFLNSFLLDVQDDVTLLNQRDATHHPMLLTIEATGAINHKQMEVRWAFRHLQKLFALGVQC